MPFRLSACLPQCLRTEEPSDNDLPRSPHDPALPHGSLAASLEAGPRSAVNVGPSASSHLGPLDASPSLTTPVSVGAWLFQLDFLFFAMADFPRTPLMLSFFEKGRELQCEELRGGVASPNQLQQLNEWQAQVRSLERHWNNMPTVSQRRVEGVERLIDVQDDARLKSLLHEQWLHADEKAQVARHAFGTGALDWAPIADQQADAHVEIAHYLLPYWERATAQQQVHLEQMFERCRQKASYADVRSFLAAAQVPGWQDCVAQWCARAARGRSGGGAQTAGEELWSAQDQYADRGAALVELRRLRTAANCLPQAYGLQAAMKHSCAMMEQVVAAGLPRLSLLQRAWIEMKGLRVAKDHEAAESVDAAARRVSELQEVIHRLPVSQRYRLPQAQRQHALMKQAYEREDYDRVRQLQDTHQGLCRATSALALKSGAELDRWEAIGEQRASLARQLKRWTDEPVRAGHELRAAYRARELFGKLDSTTDPQTCEQYLMELQAIGRSLPSRDVPPPLPPKRSAPHPFTHALGDPQ